MCVPEPLADVGPPQKLSHEALNPVATKEDNVVEPLSESATASITDSPQSSIDSWYELGLDLIAKNEVAVVLMAGMSSAPSVRRCK